MKLRRCASEVTVIYDFNNKLVFIDSNYVVSDKVFIVIAAYVMSRYV